MKQILIGIFVLCILFSCRKSSTEDNYIITGTVLDFDANTVIVGAKVYVKEHDYWGRIVDSATSDANGRVSFTYRKEGEFKFIFAAKANYLNPIYFVAYQANYNDRTENLYLARPSFINITVHQSSTYFPSDTVDIQVIGDNDRPYGYANTIYRTLLRDKANAPDKIYNLKAVYGHVIGSFYFGSSKLRFINNIVRNGAIIATQIDSTNIIQFGTQNFTLNY